MKDRSDTARRKITAVDVAKLGLGVLSAALGLLGFIYGVRASHTAEAVQVKQLLDKARVMLRSTELAIAYRTGHVPTKGGADLLVDAGDAIAEALTLDPDSSRAHRLEGVRERLLGNLDASLAEHREAVRLAPRNVRAHVRLGDVLVLRGNLKEAVESYKTALRFDSDNADALGKLATAYKQQGEKAVGDERRELFGLAHLKFEESLAIGPHDAIVHHNFGNLLRELGETERAIMEYRLARSLSEDYVQAHHHLGVLLLEARMYEEAEEALRDAVKRDPRYAEAIRTLGDLYLFQEKYGDAIEQYQRALKLRPKYFEALLNLALAQLKAGNPESAAARARAAVALRPDSPKAHRVLGHALHAAGEVADAIAHLEKVTEIDPSPTAQDWSALAAAYADAGRADEAAEARARAGQAGPR